MKKYLLFYLLFISCFYSHSQEMGQEVIQQFDMRFPQKDDKGDLIRLRDFLEDKDAAYTKIRSDIAALDKLNVNISDSSLFSRYKKDVQEFLNKNNQSEPFKESDLNRNIQAICFRDSFAFTTDSATKKNLFYVQTLNLDIDGWLNRIKQKITLVQSLDNVSKDREAAINSIQRIYNVERGNQDYKSSISIYYAGIILFLIAISFIFIFRKSSANIGNDFLNGNGLQFIALFAIIISTILFGILGILEGKELAAILSGISGFILGKGLNVNLTKKDVEKTGPIEE